VQRPNPDNQNAQTNFKPIPYWTGNNTNVHSFITSSDAKVEKGETRKKRREEIRDENVRKMGILRKQSTGRKFCNAVETHEKKWRKPEMESTVQMQ